MTSVTAFAPASVGNACVGFDVLGFAFPVVGDEVTVEHLGGDGRGRVESVEAAGVPDLPTEPTRNTASVALQALLNAHGARGSFGLRIRKGIPLSAGMGGSAASAVAAVVAANELLGRPYRQDGLLPFALEGEAAASGSYHSDNVAPCLLGGLTTSAPGPDPRVLSLPVPPDILCVLAHPHLEVDTRAARATLAAAVPLGKHTEQSANLAAFITALHRGDTALLRTCMVDILVEPQRAHLVPGFETAKAGAIAAGAIGCSIAGGGPSVFAWVEGDEPAAGVRDALVAGLTRDGTPVDVWSAFPGGAGAVVIETG